MGDRRSAPASRSDTIDRHGRDRSQADTLGPSLAALTPRDPRCVIGAWKPARLLASAARPADPSHRAGLATVGVSREVVARLDRGGHPINCRGDLLVVAGPLASLVPIPPGSSALGAVDPVRVVRLR